MKNLLPLTEIVGMAEASAAKAMPHATLREERILMEMLLLHKKESSRVDRRLYVR